MNVICPVHSEGFLKIDNFYVNDNNEVVLAFSNEVSADKVKKSIILTDYDGVLHDDYTVGECSDKNSVKISFDENYKYYLKIEKSLKSVNNTPLDRDYIFNLSFKGIKDGFNGEGYETDKWLVCGINTNQYKKAKLLDNKLFLTSYYTENNYNTIEYNGENTVYNSGSCRIKAVDYADYMFENSVLEFDYSNYSHIKSCKTYDCMRVVFRTDEYTEQTVNYGFDWHQESKQGGYLFEIYNGGTLVSLNKWNGEKVIFQNLVANNTANGKIKPLVQEKSIEYNPREVYRYRIHTKNIGNGVLIDISRAKKENGVIGTYENVITFTDTEDPLLRGTFWLNARESHNDLTRFNNWCWYTSHLIDNISFTEENKNYTICDMTKIYVSPKADSDGDGSLLRPYRDLETAKSTAAHNVEMLKKINEKQQINVILRGGEYYIDKKVTFSENDSGFDDENRIVYSAYENEKPEIKGSIVLNTDDFENVSDDSVLARLRTEVRDKVLCLDLRSSGIESIPNSPEKTENYVSLYCNGREQMISQWPDGDYNYSQFSFIDGYKGIEYLYTDRPSSWTNAKDIVVIGNLSTNYTGSVAAVESIDPDKKTINFKAAKATNKSCRRWKAINLLEEISIPGEWYIDRDNMLLYYYPSENLGTSKLELSICDDIMFELDNCKNITFRGLSFKETCGDVFYNYAKENKSIENITFEKCEFSGIGGSCINLISHLFNNLYDYEVWSNPIGKAFNIRITDNIFCNNRTTPICISSGDVIMQRADGLVISGNYAASHSSMGIISNAGLVSGSAVGADISNNLVHNTPWSAINVSGQANKMHNNEFVNTVRETIDAGTIYMGRTVIKRNTEIYNNVFRNVTPATEPLKKFSYNRAVYFDDGYCGGIVHHNIGVNGDIFVTHSGSDGKIFSNTAINFKNIANLSINTGVKSFYERLFETEHDEAACNELEALNNALPQIKEEYTILKDNGYAITVNNAVNKNYVVNGNTLTLTEAMSRYNDVSNNKYTDNCDGFINLSNYDYRLKKSETTDAYNLIDDSFNIDSVGILWEDKIEKLQITSKRPFNMLGASSDGDKITFVWEKAFDADKYRLIAASDSEMHDIVYDGYVPYNFAEISEIGENIKKLYWSVYAINETRGLSGEWQADNGIMQLICEDKDAYTPDSFEIKSIEKTDNHITAEFTDLIDENALRQNVTVYSEDGIVYNSDIKCYKNKAEISIEGVPFSQKRYYIKFSKAAASVNSVELKKDMYYSFTRNGTLDTFDGETGAVSSDYKMYSYMGDTPRNAFLYNGALFVSSDGTDAVYNGVPYARYTSLIYRNDFYEKGCDNPELSFDYCDHSVLYDNGPWSVFRMFFCVKDFEVTDARSKYNGIFTSSSKSAYFLEISSYGNELCLYKWDGENTDIGELADKVGTRLCYSRQFENYNIGDKLRFKITAKNEESGTVINVYAAKYGTDGTLGKYVNVISVCDSEKNNANGSFFMMGAGSSDCKYYFMNSRSVDNILYEKGEAVEQVRPCTIESADINACDGGYEAAVVVNSIEREPFEAVLYNAAYSGEKLEGAVGSARFEIKTGKNEYKIKLPAAPKTEGTFFYKVFLWNPDSQKPMCKALVYN